ncbi:type IV secretory system conjugative DNA transfer family protein, partial [Streptomyces sp. Ru87]|uniref:type IV secretory system conjugative DNA transfer family protein n=1 Tax=Streptomyces sp. Ru87 TaxID=2044307 RepID=UPI00211D3F83
PPAAAAHQPPGTGTAHETPRHRAYGDGTEGPGHPYPETAEPPAPPTALRAATAPAAPPGPRAVPVNGPNQGTTAPWGVHFTGTTGATGTTSATGPTGGTEARRRLALRAVTGAAGPLLVVTSDPALWAETKDARGKLGPSHLYDPGQLLDTPSRLRWSPVSGCESREVAARRACALLAPVRPPSALDSAMAETAETLLRSWLHAAAVDDRPFRQVHRWASGAAAHEPVRILRTNTRAAGGSAGELEGALTAYPERRELAQELTARALSALSSVHIRNACNPTRADALALESFVAEGGTLYVVGESIEDPRARPGAMPFLTALVSAVVEHGRRVAERRPGGRLDPPLTLVLDDIAAVAPVPELPELVASGPARGLPTLALLRSEEQARARWPRHSLVS